MRTLFDLICMDARRLRWLFGIWLLVLGCRWALAVYAEPFLPGAPGDSVVFALDMMLLALAFSMTCLSVLEHSPVRTRSPWRTRPLSRRVVLAAKLSFWLLFLALPFLAAKALTAAHFGLEGWPLLALLWKDILVGLQVSVVAFAAAALTRRLREALVAAVLVPLAAGWAFVVPTLLLPTLRGSSESMSILVALNQNLLYSLAPIVAAAGAVVLLFWTRGRRRAAVVFILSGSFCLGLLAVLRPDLPGWQLFPICRSADLPKTPIRLSLHSLHEVELPPDVEIEEPRKGKRMVSLQLQGSSDAQGLIFVGVAHKARLRWPEGESRTYLGEISGSWTVGSPMGLATGTEEIFQTEPFHFRYLSAWLEVEPKELERFGARPAEYRGTLDLMAMRYRVLTELPLARGSTSRGNGFHITVDEVLLRPKGLKVTITDRSLQSLLTGRSIESYALLNRSRGELIELDVPYAEQNRSTRTIWGWDEETRISKLVLRFSEGAPVDEEWIRGAVLVVFESVCLGRPKVSLHIADFRMADLTHEVIIAKMREVKRRRDEAKAQKANEEERTAEQIEGSRG